MMTGEAGRPELAAACVSMGSRTIQRTLGIPWMSIHNWVKQLQGHRIATRCFIVGAPRSGTTLVQARLARHPQLISFFETHLYPRAHGIGSRPEVRAGRSGSDIYREELCAMVTGICSALDIAPAPVRLLRGRRVNRLRASFFQCLDEIAWRGKCRGWIEKTPAHVRYIPAIERDLPDARFIHVVREGIPVVASLLEVTRRYPQGWGGAPWSLAQCVDTWNRDTAISLEYQHKPGHRLIPCEYFVSETASCMNKLWQFIGVDPALAVADDAEKTTAVVRPFEHWKQDVMRPVQPARNDRFSTIMSPAEIEWARAHLHRQGRLSAGLFK